MYATRLATFTLTASRSSKKKVHLAQSPGQSTAVERKSQLCAGVRSRQAPDAEQPPGSHHEGRGAAGSPASRRRRAQPSASRAE